MKDRDRLLNSAIPQPRERRRGTRTGRPPKLHPEDHILVAAEVALLRGDLTPLRGKRQRGAADEVSKRMGGLIGADRVEQIYKRCRSQLPKTTLKLAALSISFNEQYAVPEDPDPALDPDWLKRQTNESLSKWFEAKYYRRWKNPRQRRAALKALQEELIKR